MCIGAEARLSCWISIVHGKHGRSEIGRQQLCAGIARQEAGGCEASAAPEVEHAVGPAQRKHFQQPIAHLALQRSRRFVALRRT